MRREHADALHTVECGAGSLDCLLIHGLGDGAYIWNKVATQLAPVMPVIAPDLRGHGDSLWSPTGDYTLDAYSHDLSVLLNRNGGRRWIAAGHSLGADLAAGLALRWPERVVALILIDYTPAPPREAIEYLRSDFAAKVAARYQSIDEYGARLRAMHPFARPDVLADLAACAMQPLPEGGFGLKCDPRVLNWTPEEELSQADRKFEELGRIHVPTLLARGSASAWLPRAEAERIASRVLQRGELQTIRRAGHAVITDNPEAVASAILKFVVKLGLES